MNNMRSEWSAYWIDESKNSFNVKTTDGTLKTFTKGTWLILPGRNDQVIIDSIVSPFHNREEREILGKHYGCTNKTETILDNELGPRGITYLPWRYDERRFATMSYTMHGNSRFIICYPVGMRHFGQHINWDLVEITCPPDNIDDALVNKLLERGNE